MLAEAYIHLANGDRMHVVDGFDVRDGLIRSLTYFTADYPDRRLTPGARLPQARRVRAVRRGQRVAEERGRVLVGDARELVVVEVGEQRGERRL